MSSIIRSIEGISGNALGESLAFGVGFALGAALDPAATAIRQEAWKIDPLRAPDATTLAEGVATGQVDEAKAKEWAKEHGIGDDAFGALVDIANTGPALGYAFQAWRRGAMSDAEFTTALRRTGLETQWDDALRALKSERLDLGALATAIHRGIVASNGLLVREPPQGEGRIPRIPQSQIDAVHEAEAHGIDQERLRVLIANTGLPLALGEMLRLLNMGHVTEDDVRVAVSESNIRNEYMDAALELRRRLLTPHEYAEGRVRGLKTTPELHAGAALSGMEAADADFLYELQGRPLTVRQITTGLARGGKYGGEYEGVPEPYLDAIRRSSTRPEYGSLAYANRYSYSVPLWWRTLFTAGALDETEAHQILLDLGNPPDLARKITDHFAGGGAGKADTHVAKAQTHLWTATHKAYTVDEVDAAEATAKLHAAGVAAESVPEVLAVWDAERELIRLTLTPTQIKKAYAAAKYTRDEAVGYLPRLGMSAADAGTLLDE